MHALIPAHRRQRQADRYRVQDHPGLQSKFPVLMSGSSPHQNMGIWCFWLCGLLQVCVHTPTQTRIFRNTNKNLKTTKTETQLTETVSYTNAGRHWVTMLTYTNNKLTMQRKVSDINKNQRSKQYWHKRVKWRVVLTKNKINEPLAKLTKRETRPR